MNHSSLEYFILDLERFLKIIFHNFEYIIKKWGFSQKVYYNEKEKESKSFIEEFQSMKIIIEKFILDNELEITVPDDFSFTRFEDILNDSAPQSFSLAPDIAMDESKLGKLERILSVNLHEIANKYFSDNPSEEFKTVQDNFNELCGRKRYWYLEIVNFTRLNPIDTLKLLVNLVENINPKPIEKQELRNNFFSLVQQNLRYGWAHTLAYAPISQYADFNPSNMSQAEMKKKIEFLKGKIKRLSFDIQRELSLGYFILEVLYRFKQRAELYDFKRLYNIANEIEEGRVTRNAEEKLTVEMCKFFFDNGFTPFYRLNIGELEIDVLDPGAININPLIIEAKVTSRLDKNYLLNGIKQLFSYLRRMSEKYHLNSAYYVIFRIGGPQYVLPEHIEVGNFMLFPVVINIAPPDEDGSRTGDIVEIELEEIKENLK